MTCDDDIFDQYKNDWTDEQLNSTKKERYKTMRTVIDFDVNKMNEATGIPTIQTDADWFNLIDNLKKASERLLENDNFDRDTQDIVGFIQSIEYLEYIPHEVNDILQYCERR